MSEPIRVPCEGSGCCVHNPERVSPVITLGICAMCGEWVAAEGGCAVDHPRTDVLTMLERGDFDGPADLRYSTRQVL